MTDYLTEQEQIELLKNWIKQYSAVIIAGVLLAILGITGWRYFQSRETKMLTHASAVYDEMLTKRAQNNIQETLVQANKLFTHYSNTSYSQLAAFMLARDAALNNQTQEAQKYLSWIMKHSNIPSFRQIARIRLARILITAQKPDEALRLLKKQDDKSFNSLINEIKGDAYFAQGNIAMAKLSYKNALDNLPNAEATRPILQMKYDNLSTYSSS
ncbi:MAG: hypothetical protein A3F12_03040 [Gammaproteobacteria bacterium RIFCSPHIGHO2_12_FULL_38_14]|nr:MAG: hypothetical protein A3F12_03040 [Gammaproteobacteria bacterium RIFCSPHIGHO2_12_FULL_38_14]